MKNSIKYLAIAFVICILYSATSFADDTKQVSVATEAELTAALVDETIQLISVESDITISEYGDIPIKGLFKEINGNGHKISLEDDSYYVNLKATEFVDIRDITFSGEKVSLDMVYGGRLDHVLGDVHVHSMALLQADNCELAGVIINDGDNSYIKNSTVNGATRISDSSNCIIEDCEIISNDEYGVSIVYFGNGDSLCEIKGSTVKGPTALYALAYGHSITVEDTLLEGTERGILNNGTMGGGSIILDNSNVKSSSSVGIENKQGSIIVPEGSTLTLDTNNNIGILLIKNGCLNINKDANIVHADNNYTVFKQESSHIEDESSLLEETVSTGVYSLYLLKGKDEGLIEKREATVRTSEEFVGALSNRSIQKITVGTDIDITDISNISIGGTLKEIDGNNYSVSANQALYITAAEFTIIKDITFSGEKVSLDMVSGGRLDHVLGDVHVHSMALLHANNCELAGVIINDGDNSYIKDSTVNGATRISDSSNCIIEDCEIISNDEYGVSIVYFGNGDSLCEIKGSTVKGPTALYALAYGHSITVEDTLLEGTERGILNNGTMDGGSIILDNSNVKSSSSVGIENKQGSIIVPEGSTLTLDTNNSIGINNHSSGQIVFNAGCIVNYSGNSYCVLNDDNSGIDYSNSFLTAFPVNGTNDTGYILTDDVNCSFIWESDCKKAKVVLNSKQNSAIQRIDDAIVSSIVMNEASCTESGVIRYTAVFEMFSEYKDFEIDALGHIWNDGTTVDVSSSCTEDGSQSIHCLVCNDVKPDSVTVIPAIGHDWDSGKITAEPTCTKEGVKTFSCSRCEETKTEAILATGHDFEKEFTVDTEPTCTEKGVKSRHCTKCDEVTEVTAIPAAGHFFGEWVEITPNTCENEGLRQHTCEVCGKVESENLNPNGHDWEENFTIDLGPTCTTDGSQSIHCMNCDSVKDSESIPALGHSYRDWAVIKEATCDSAGTKEKTCSVCSEKVTEEIPALGHAWNEQPTIDKAATCTETGSQSIHCARCNDTKDSEIVPALGHEWNISSTVDKVAMCTEDGAESIHCSRCDVIQEGSEKVIPKIRHQFSAWETTKAATEIAAGQKTRTCSECGHVEKRTIAMLKPILPAVKITTPKAAKKATTIKWKKVSKANQKKIAKIEIQYSLDKKFKTEVKTVYGKKTATSKKITKLKSKKTYYVRIRAYKKSGRVVHVSKWSTVKKVRVK